MTLIELIGTSSLSLVQHTKHISANIPLHYFTKGGSGAEPPKKFCVLLQGIVIFVVLSKRKRKRGGVQGHVTCSRDLTVAENSFSFGNN